MDVDVYMCARIVSVFTDKLKLYKKFDNLTSSMDMITYITNVIMNENATLYDERFHIHIKKDDFMTWMGCLEDTLGELGIQGKKAQDIIRKVRKCEHIVVEEYIIQDIDSKIRKLQELRTMITH